MISIFRYFGIGREPLLFILDLSKFEKESRRRLKSILSNMAAQGVQPADTESTLLEFAMSGLEGARQSITRPNVQEIALR